MLHPTLPPPPSPSPHPKASSTSGTLTLPQTTSTAQSTRSTFSATASSRSSRSTLQSRFTQLYRAVEEGGLDCASKILDKGSVDQDGLNIKNKSNSLPPPPPHPTPTHPTPRPKASRQPLLLQYHSKLAHYPLQAPEEYLARFSHIEDDNRRVYAAMIAFLDDQVGALVDAFKQHGLWEDTLMIAWVLDLGRVELGLS